MDAIEKAKAKLAARQAKQQNKKAKLSARSEQDRSLLESKQSTLFRLMLWLEGSHPFVII